MIWTNETIFLSQALDAEEIAISLQTVFERMEENKRSDNAIEAKALLFTINSTNGFIKIIWWDNDAQTAIGKLIYEVRPKELWEDEDAFDFEKACWFAVFEFTEIFMITKTGAYLYDVYIETETTRIEQVLI